MIHPIPSRHARRPARTSCASCARSPTAMRERVRRRAATARSPTPALEYEEVLTRGDSAAADPAYRLFDEHGNVLVLRSDMTIPIARVVATRYPSAPVPLRFSYLAARLPRRAPAPRAAARDPAGRDRARRRARAGGHGGGVSVLCAALDAAGLSSYRVGLGDASLFRRALERAGVPEDARAAILHELATRDLVGLERELARRRARASCSSSRARAAGVEVLDGVPEGEPLRALYALLAHDVARARDLRPRARAHARLLHGRGVRGLRRRVRRRRSAAAGATTTCSGASGASCPPAAGRSTSSACTRRGWEEGAMRIAVPRGAMFKETLDLLDTLGIDTREVRANDRKLLFEDAGHHHDAAVRRPDLRRGRRRRPRHHGQGRAGRAGRARRLRAARPRLRRRAGWCSRPSRARTPRPRRCGGWA